MGVPGLTTFLDTNSQLLTDHKLRTTKIIIDGNNLYHFLYNLYAVPVQFGGDYDVFASVVTSFFKTLLKCEIQPVVVFDGPYDPNDTKIKTAVKRARDRISHAQNAVCGKKANLTPIFAQSVFTNVLNDLRIDHVTCESEADSEIAALANTLQCPILTNDSDFFIFDVQGGVVLLDYVNLEIRKEHGTLSSEPEYFLNVQMYYFQKFVDLFPDMDKNLLPLFATILGNEKTEAKTFETFFTSVRLPNHCSHRLYSGKRHSKMLGLLSWLESCGSLEAAIKKILNQYNQEKRAALRTLIMNCVDLYRNIQVSKIYPYLLVKWSAHRLPETSPDLPTEAQTPDLGERHLPDWFKDKLWTGHLSALTSNAAVSRQVILPTQAENLSKPSSHQAALSLRRVVYGILLQNSPIGSTKQRGMHIEEIDRDVNNQRRRLVDPKLEVISGTVPVLADVLGVSLEQRTGFFTEAAGILSSTLCSWPTELQLYFTAVVYWIRNSSLRIDWLHLTATILCVLKLSVVDRVASVDTCDEEISEKSGGLMESIRSLNADHDNTCIEISKKLDRFMEAPKGKSHSPQADVSIIHAFSELQACLFATCCLNEALALPLRPPRLDRLFSGSLLYHLYRELRSRLRPEQYIPELLAGSDRLQVLLHSWTNSIKDCLKPGDLILDLAAGSKRSKKSKAKKLAKQASTDSGTERRTPPCEVVASCDVTNKFELLMLADT